MNCPWCPFTGAPRALHAHMGDEHGEQVVMEERIGRSFYGIDCPVCGDGYRHEIKPRGRDPGFVAEFTAQIRLVAFDMLVNHLLVEHDPEAAALAEPVPPESQALAPPAGAGPAWLMTARRAAAQAQDPPETTG